MVPFLVTSRDPELPILGYNVIAELAKYSEYSPGTKTLCPGVSLKD